MTIFFKKVFDLRSRVEKRRKAKVYNGGKRPIGDLLFNPGIRKGYPLQR